MVALADGKPQTMGLKTILKYYLAPERGSHKKDKERPGGSPQ